jgi:lipoyl(octanoyl) transferase
VNTGSQAISVPLDPASAYLNIREFGLLDYETVWHAMQNFTDSRDAATADEIWLVQHPPVFTLGQAGRKEHILAAGDIPVVQSDRGGQVTYHGPGQIVAYPLLDIRRLGMNVKDLVCSIEEAVIRVLKKYGIKADRATGAPGVYVEGMKIAALGLRVRRGCSFHGLAFNINMDLEPYQRINPCGFEGLKVTQLAAFQAVDLQQVQNRLIACLAEILGYNNRLFHDDGTISMINELQQKKT